MSRGTAAATANSTKTPTTSAVRGDAGRNRPTGAGLTLGFAFTAIPAI
jgi:hypothetical protein